MGDESFRTSPGGPLPGRGDGDVARRFDRGVRAGGHDVVYTDGKVVGGVGISPILPGRGAGCHLACSCGIAGTLLPGIGFAPSSAAAITGRFGKTVVSRVQAESLTAVCSQIAARKN